MRVLNVHTNMIYIYICIHSPVNVSVLIPVGGVLISVGDVPLWTSRDLRSNLAEAHGPPRTPRGCHGTSRSLPLGSRDLPGTLWGRSGDPPDLPETLWERSGPPPGPPGNPSNTLRGSSGASRESPWKFVHVLQIAVVLSIKKILIPLGSYAKIYNLCGNENVVSIRPTRLSQWKMSVLPYT